MANPLVSIGLPVYNGERYLGDALESLIAQDYVNLEIIVSDNGSTDATPDIARQYAAADPRVRCVRTPINRGSAWNFNEVFRLSRGPYFKWAAHDDLCSPDYVRVCVEGLEASSETVLCHTQAVRISDDGSLRGPLPGAAYGTSPRPSERVRDFLREPSACTEVFGVARAVALGSTRLIGPYTSSDRALLLEMALRGRIQTLQEGTFYSREHEGRSIRQYADPRARLQWFDPSKSRKTAFARWRLLRAYLSAVYGAPCALEEKVQSARHVAEWAGRQTPYLARELISGLSRSAAQLAGP